MYPTPSFWCVMKAHHTLADSTNRGSLFRLNVVPVVFHGPRSVSTLVAGPGPRGFVQYIGCMYLLGEVHCPAVQTES